MVRACGEKDRGRHERNLSTEKRSTSPENMDHKNLVCQPRIERRPDLKTPINVQSHRTCMLQLSTIIASNSMSGYSSETLRQHSRNSPSESFLRQTSNKEAGEHHPGCN